MSSGNTITLFSGAHLLLKKQNLKHIHWNSVITCHFLTCSLRTWDAPPSQTMAQCSTSAAPVQHQGSTRAAPVQHQCSCDSATTNRSFRALFYTGFNFKQREFWWSFFPHFLYIGNRTQDVGFQDITQGKRNMVSNLRALQWSHYCAWKLRTFPWRDRSAIFWRKGMRLFFQWAMQHQDTNDPFLVHPTM